MFRHPEHIPGLRDLVFCVLRKQMLRYEKWVPPCSGRKDDLQPKIMFVSTLRAQLGDDLYDGVSEWMHAKILEDQDHILTVPEWPGS